MLTEVAVVCCLNVLPTTRFYTSGHSLALHAALPCEAAGRQGRAGDGWFSSRRPGDRRGVRCGWRDGVRDRPDHAGAAVGDGSAGDDRGDGRSEEHTSELQSLMRISSAVFCLNKTDTQTNKTHSTSTVRMERHK